MWLDERLSAGWLSSAWLLRMPRHLSSTAKIHGASWLGHAGLAALGEVATHQNWVSALTDSKIQFVNSLRGDDFFRVELYEINSQESYLKSRMPVCDFTRSSIIWTLLSPHWLADILWRPIYALEFKESALCQLWGSDPSIWSHNWPFPTLGLESVTFLGWE